MSDTFQRERERAYARQRLSVVFDAPERAYAIHYALQRLRRGETDLAPPVAAVAIRGIGTGKERVFSIKAEAERSGIDLAAPVTTRQMLALEYSLLFNLNEFLSSRADRFFVHWYMRDERFGFQALEARFRRVLAEISQDIYGVRNVASAVAFGFGGGSLSFPVQVPEDRRIDLAQVLRQLYDIGPVNLRVLAQSNALSLADMIEGVNEPAAFAQGNHAHLAWSSASKAHVIAELARLAHRGTIKSVEPPAAGRRHVGLKIFINYRREDAEAAANWLHEMLSHEFGDANVFIDTDDIPAGIDFEAFLQRQIDSCDVFLAMIGRGWASATDANGHRRLGSTQDFVRSEIRAALARGIPVIPVLIEGAPLPTEMQLPADIMPLRRRQAVELRSREFRQDVECLVGKIREAHTVARESQASVVR